ncbi:MAG: alpha/beta hydrolase [Lachnospiraceae bacterium]|nr:alpha/beta hydrolase [Lachnospiraceae bacterium]MBD5511587.1 alpha/beta hydrolase [Lachnospiraceae bacterium]
MSKIAVYFPGIGYHCDKPLLYYSRSIASKLGYENLKNVTYAYSAGNIRGNIEKMKEAYEALFSQSEAELANIVWSEYDDILFVSKSIGTIIAASYAKKYGLEGIRHILYTPLAQTFLFTPNNAIGFIGTADPWSNIDEITQLSAENHIPLITYEGCNHSLECDDALKNIETLKDVMQKTRNFIEKSIIK